MSFRPTIEAQSYELEHFEWVIGQGISLLLVTVYPV